MRTDLLKLWKLKSRIHAFVLILGSLAAVPYVVEHNLVWAATWRLLVLLLVHQHLLVLSHRLLWHTPPAISSISRAFRAFLRGFITLCYIEGPECVHAVHNTTQASQNCEEGCLSEAVLWFSPQYLNVKDDSFISRAYILKHLAIQVCIYALVFSSFPFLSIGTQLWWFLILFNSPVLSRVLFYQGHSFLHHGKESLLYRKAQNFTSRPYVRQAYNLHLRGPKSVSKYLLGFLYLGDHLHNNHHHNPNALYQGYEPSELDGTCFYYFILDRLGLITIEKERA